MRAIVVQISQQGSYYATTENSISLVFHVVGVDRLKLNEVIEVDLPNLLTTQQVLRPADGKRVSIRIKTNDMHDLTLPASHGTSRFPSPERLAGGT